MFELVVITFERNKYRASDVLLDVRCAGADWTGDIGYAIATYRNYDGSLHVEYGSGVSAAEGAAWGGLWGCFVGAMVAIPFMAAASGLAAVAALAAGALIGFGFGAIAGAIDASWSREDVYADTGFVRQLGVVLRPGDSAILAVVEASSQELVAERFMKYGGTVRRSPLSSAETVRIEGYLSDRPAA